MAKNISQSSKSLSGHATRLFTSSRSWWLKILGAGAVGLVLAVRSIRQLWDEASPVELVLYLAIIPLVAMVLAGVLIRADVARRRLRAGEPVGWIARLFFGYGIWSLLLWVIVLLFVGFPVAIIAGNLTSGVPAG